jgi:hypothetical protein
MEVIMKLIKKDKAADSVSNIIRQVSQKQDSVRTTFTLSKDGEAALTWIATVYKKKIKSLIDMICREYPIDGANENLNLTAMIIEIARNTNDQLKRDVRKSVVLSKTSLSVLNELSKRNQISRDVILDRGFCLVYEIMKENSEIKRKEYEVALKNIESLLKQAEKTENELKKRLSDDDPVLQRLGYAIIVLGNLSIDIKNELEKGIPVNPDKM